MGTVADAAVWVAPPVASEEPATEFHCTGFSRFCGVAVNPSQLIIEALPTHLAAAPLRGAAVAEARVLDTAAVSAAAEVGKMYGAASGKERVVFVHLGVNVCSRRFCVEMQARNEATFTFPDELGWAPVKRCIEDGCEDLSAVRQTGLPLGPLVEDLRGKGFDVGISSDAGKFVCNWVYYNSLQLAEKTGAEALFVHVPPASVVSIEKQTAFIAELLNSLSALRR